MSSGLFIEILTGYIKDVIFGVLKFQRLSPGPLGLDQLSITWNFIQTLEVLTFGVFKHCRISLQLYMIEYIYFKVPEENSIPWELCHGTLYPRVFKCPNFTEVTRKTFQMT